MKKIKKMTNEELVDQMEKTTRAWHYDPFCDYEKLGFLNYTIEDLKSELLKRLKTKEV